MKKQPIFVGTLMSSVISTTDNASWKRQRAELNEAFLPVSAVSQTLPISQARSAACVAKLARLRAEDENNEVGRRLCVVDGSVSDGVAPITVSLALSVLLASSVLSPHCPC
mgnify:FL=1